MLCQFLVLAGNRQFFCCGGKVFLRPEKKVPFVCLAGCAVVSVFGSGGKLAVFLLWRESFITTGKKKFKLSVWRVVLLCQFLVLAGNRQFFCCGGKVSLRPEKKFQSSVWWVVLLCQFLVLAITTGKKKFKLSLNLY